MALLQTEYNSRPAKGNIGGRANMEEWNTITCHPEADGAIGFAYPVQDGTVGDQIVEFSAGYFRGITEYDASVEADCDGNRFYPKGYNTPVCEIGVIFGLAVAACTKRTPVYWNPALKGYQSASGGGAIKIPNAVFDETEGAGNPVAIRLRRVPAA